MSLREARPGIAQLKRKILERYPDTVLREGPGFEGGPRDVYLYAYANEDMVDTILEISSPRVSDILLKTGVLVHVIPLRPGTMKWLWDNGKKGKARRASRRAPTARASPRVLAERRAAYKTGKPRVRRKTT